MVDILSTQRQKKRKKGEAAHSDKSLQYIRERQQGCRKHYKTSHCNTSYTKDMISDRRNVVSLSYLLSVLSRSLSLLLHS